MLLFFFLLGGWSASWAPPARYVDVRKVEPPRPIDVVSVAPPAIEFTIIPVPKVVVVEKFIVVAPISVDIGG